MSNRSTTDDTFESLNLLDVVTCSQTNKLTDQAEQISICVILFICISQTGKLNEMLQVGENPDDLKQLGILLDAESFAEDQVEDQGSPARKQCNRMTGSGNNSIDRY